ncbi:hypothetical protein FQA39_LY05450 [Lamprigera yunnana]|nr:hypothetical protein FQA39_LY05450 [Lamprigera yunnana]
MNSFGGKQECKLQRQGPDWKLGIIKERLRPRSYKIKTNEGKELIRNRKFIETVPDRSSDITPSVTILDELNLKEAEVFNMPTVSSRGIHFFNPLRKLNKTLPTNTLIKMSEGKSTRFPQYLAAITVCLGAVATGTALGWTGNIALELKSGEFNDMQISDTEFGWIGSLTNLGAMCICFPIGFICDKIGRKFATLLLTIPFIAGWLLIIFSTNVTMLYIGRFIIGLAGGGFCIAAPLYTSEIAEKNIRGALGSFFQLFVTIGILLSYILGYAVSIRILTIVVAVVPLIFCIAFLFQPETPVYRLKQKRDEEAKAILTRLRGKKYNIDVEIVEIKEALDELEKNNVTIKDSLKKRSTRIAAIVSFSLMFFQQAGGINAVIFYTSDIFSSSGSSLKPNDATMIIGAIQVIATLIASGIVDILGRRILLLLSSIFMAIGLIVLGVFFSLKDRNLVSADVLSTLGFMPIVGLAVFITMFSLGFGPIPWMISSELYPSEIKSVASAAAGTFNWLMAFLITKFYGDLKSKVGGDVTFYIFAGICILETTTAEETPDPKTGASDATQRTHAVVEEALEIVQETHNADADVPQPACKVKVKGQTSNSEAAAVGKTDDINSTDATRELNVVMVSTPEIESADTPSSPETEQNVDLNLTDATVELEPPAKDELDKQDPRSHPR